MAIAMPSPIPYIILFSVIVIITIACFAMISSLRKYRSRKNLVVYGVVALMLGLTAYLAVNVAYEASMGPMMVTYDLNHRGTPFYAGQTSQFTVTCETYGRRETSFYLVLNGENASIAADNQEYIQMNDTAIKIPFTLNNIHQEAVKTVYFKINENASSCRFYTDTEPLPPSNHVPIVTGATVQVDCIRNPRTNSFNFTAMPGPCV